MRVFFTSDTHFSHRTLAKVRNFASIEEMDEVLIANWNRTVKVDDTVYHLGDWFGKHIHNDAAHAVIHRLNGRFKTLMGNHDQNGFGGHTQPNNIAVSSSLVSQNLGSYHEFKIGDREFVLSHYPMLRWNKSHYGAIMLHGHCHGGINELGIPRLLDVGVDSICKLFGGDKIHLRPISLNEVLAIIR